jgi:peroxiredoxin Q/BCP
MVAEVEKLLNLVLANIWLILFVGWGLPLSHFRSRFRKLVYQTDSWIIVIKPVFLKELKALFSNLYPGDVHYLRLRNFYRFYLEVYTLLFIAWQILR